MHFASSFRDLFAHGTRNLVYYVSLDVLFVLSLNIYWVGLFYGRVDYEVSTELTLKVFWLAIFFCDAEVRSLCCGLQQEVIWLMGRLNVFFCNNFSNFHICYI